MALNKFIVQGRIPTSDKLPFSISDYGSDEKKAVLRGMISVQRSYKKEGEKYYPEDLLFFKAFSSTAIFLDKYFNRGDNLILEGEIRKDDDYEKDGQAVRGQIYLHVVPNGVYFQKGNTAEESASTTNTKTVVPVVVKSNPLAKSVASSGNSLNPLKKRSVV